MRKSPSFNERAWAIDLISEINRLVSSGRRIIKGAGGEWGVSADPHGNVMFPDVLLFGDPAHCAVLQGWELKMPDTPVTDSELLENAQEKCRRLGLTSFLVWNGAEAVLYQAKGRSWEILKTWHCAGMGSREDVRRNKTVWVTMVSSIIEDVNDYFEQGTLSSEKPLPSQLNEVVATMLTEWTSRLALHFADEFKLSRTWRTEVSIWWRGTRAEHGIAGETGKFDLLATEVLLHWMHRFIFAHYLRRYVADAKGLDGWDEKTTIPQAEKWFKTLSEKHDYAQIFRSYPGAATVPPDVWRSLMVFNRFLREVRLVDMDQQLFQETLQTVRQESQRKIAGQFCTPKALASFLVQLTVDDLTRPVLDPCCGTGMIAREAVALKMRGGSSSAEAIQTTWASDRYAMPVQFAELALVSGEAPFETLRDFQHDATTLKPGQAVSFVNARTGKKSSEPLPMFSYIVLNPPFVRFENWMKAESSIKEIRDFIKNKLGEEMDSKSDYFVPIILHLWRLLADAGRLGVIMPNAWLGAKWGVSFRRNLQKLFAIEAIVSSGEGRWFQNADIVTTLVILTKKKIGDNGSATDKTTFAMTRRPLAEWVDDEITEMCDSIVSPSASSSPIIKLNHLTENELESYDKMGLCWSAHFTNLNWLSRAESSLVPVSSLFNVGRGERRGWDKLFFPSEDEGIEDEYILPVLLSAATVQGLVAEPTGRAFCCSRSIKELEALKHVGALKWIRRFQRAVNTKGVALPKSVAQSGYHWYEMRPDTLADLAVSMNPGEKLFFARLTPRAFVNQRLIRLVAKTSVTNVELSHALLCSFLGCFYLEALGFGRGLGVLDINATKVSKQMRMLNPAAVSVTDRKAILNAFDVLKRRNVLSLEEEIKCGDRLKFEAIVLNSFGLGNVLPQVQESLIDLHRIRSAVER